MLKLNCLFSHNTFVILIHLLDINLINLLKKKLNIFFLRSHFVELFPFNFFSNIKKGYILIVSICFFYDYLYILNFFIKNKLKISIIGIKINNFFLP